MRAAEYIITDETYIKKYSARPEAAVASSTSANIPKAAVVATMASGVHCNIYVHLRWSTAQSSRDCVSAYYVEIAQYYVQLKPATHLFTCSQFS